MNEELRRAIARRRQEATDKKINEKALLVAEQLGKQTRIDRHGTVGTVYEFEMTKLKIVFRIETVAECLASTRFMAISYKEHPVFQKTDNIINGYVPGIWESTIEFFLPQAEELRVERARATAQKEAAATAEDERAERAKWGL